MILVSSQIATRPERCRTLVCIKVWNLVLVSSILDLNLVDLNLAIVVTILIIDGRHLYCLCYCYAYVVGLFCFEIDYCLCLGQPKKMAYKKLLHALA